VLFKQADREGLTGRTGLAGWTGEKGEQAEFFRQSRPLGKVEIDCQRQPEGRAERERTSQPERSAATSQFREFFNIIKKIEIRRAGAFVARMWLSKKQPSASDLASVSFFDRQSRQAVI
jgi:hypothetical protein